VYETIFVEERNKPAVMLAFNYFANDAESAASSKGMPGIRVVPESIVSECTVVEEIEAGISPVMDKIISALTAPMTEEEKSPKSKQVEEPSRIIFKGNLQEVNRFFYLRGWTDGLPVIPPTEEAVAEMLTGTDLPAGHIVAELEPRLGKATVEKIAINAVMAGALPTYMPLLIAGVKALDKHPMADMWAVSTGSWSPFWVVNGPIRNDLHINNGFGALSPGDIANAAIGRALGLITKNIRGVRKGVEDMGVFGNPGKYSMVIAENEEDSPWAPLHVDHGFRKEDSTISLSFPNNYLQLVCYGTDIKGILSTMIYNVMPGMMGMLDIMLTPAVAKSLAGSGWTKEDVKNFVLENARVPFDHHPNYWSATSLTMNKRQPTNPRDSYAMLRPSLFQTDPIRIFVAGGWGSWVGFLPGQQDVTQKVELPANWDELVAKYKNVVPTYAKY
jgi:hypothetical protein